MFLSDLERKILTTPKRSTMMMIVANAIKRLPKNNRNEISQSATFLPGKNESSHEPITKFRQYIEGNNISPTTITNTPDKAFLYIISGIISASEKKHSTELEENLINNLEITQRVTLAGNPNHHDVEQTRQAFNLVIKKLTTRYKQKSSLIPSNQEIHQSIENQVNSIIDNVLNKKPTTIYHQLIRAEDFESVQNSGFKGQYAVIEPENQERKALLKKNGEPFFRTFFILVLPPIINKAHWISMDINTSKDVSLNIYDNRKGDLISYSDLINKGFNGIIGTAGVGVPLDQKYMLTLFDGASYAGRINKLE